MTNQGKTSNVTAIAIMAEHAGKSIPETGTMIFRARHTPVTLGAFAGRTVGKHFHPVRETLTDRWAREHDAPFDIAGDSMRARY